MRKIFTLTFLLVAVHAQAQEYGLSFSYFIPTAGEISMPISPFSIRGLGFNITNSLSFETGASLYRMAGLNIKNLPYVSDKSLLGPNFTVFIPAQLALRFSAPRSRNSLSLKAGGFGFMGFFQKLNAGNFDRAIRDYGNWAAVNSDFTFKNYPGYGYMAGIGFDFAYNRNITITIEANYLNGASSLPIRGSYIGAKNGVLETVNIDYNRAKVDLSGIEFSIGFSYKN